MDNFQLSELAQKAKNGDMAAFEKLYIELSPEIYAIACEITQNKEESYDLVQDCFVAALENISTLNEPDKIKNWLIRIAANKSRDYLKKKKPSVLTEDQYEVIDNLEEDDIAVIPEASLETEERIEDVNEILGCLTEEKRLCLLLRFKYDMSYAEIANELCITESAVKSRISRAKDDVEKEAEKRKKKGLPLFGIAPFGLVIFALNRSADITAATFAGSTAQTAAFAGVTAASQAGIAVASTAATATTASAAGTTATAATGIGAKVAAMSVAQKVIAGVTAATIATGSATVTTVIVKNKIEAKEEITTVYVEEFTTVPDYGFESETVFIPAVAETENQTTEPSTSNTTTVTQTKETEKSTVENKTTTQSTSKEKITTQKQSATKEETTTKATTTTTTVTTTKAATTATTTKATTTEEETTTQTSTAKATTTTTTQAVTATTTTTTESASPATVTLTVWGEETSTTKTLYFDAGEVITATEIENRLSDEYGIEAIADDINITAEAGGNYTATAYE